ncbi:MAG TPA: hypothetical protein DIC18_01405 [Clostridiales bacterium]|nr:hypothetical protein [Clostridiales bacterium]
MKIGVLFGGRSYEHDISIITAVQAACCLQESAEVYPLYACKGRFYLITGKFEIKSFADKSVKKKEVCFEKSGIRLGRKSITLDCMLMCCHGGEGENGTFSALMEVYDIPYTSCGVLASAQTMDKRMTKLLCERFLIDTPAYVFGHRGEDVPQRAKSLSYPLIVKPARLGSSIGIDIAHNEEELIRAVGVAFSFDQDVLVEQVIENATELNCAAFYEKGNIIVGGVENPRSWHEFLTFEEKYQGGKYKTGGNKIVTGELAERVRALTEKIYKAFELFGIVRIDYLYCEKTDTLYLNEVNSQPGSLAYYLFEEVGIDFSDLLLRVTEEAKSRSSQNDIIIFNSGVLDNLSVFDRK